ncbi:MAG: HAD family phosphatase [Prevotella sp.]|nr:HAD family phosphatase [Prevotella sp.]
MKIKTIIYDYGGVIMTSAQEEAVRRFSEIGIVPDLMPLDKYNQQGVFLALEDGSITADEFRDELNRRCGRNNTHDDYRWACLGYVGEIPKRNLQLFLLLRKKGYRQLLLSNTNPYMMSWAMSPDFDGEGRALCDYLDACYCSYELRMLKPNPAIFQFVIDHENITPETTIFVDDNESNIRVARDMGFHTLQPVNGVDWTNDLLHQLDDFGGMTR